MRWNIVEKTEMAAEGYQGVSEKDAIELGYDEYALDKTTGNESANLTVDGADVTETDDKGGWTVKFPSGNVYTVDKNGKITGPTTGDGGDNGGLLGDQPSTGPQITVDGAEEPVILTKDNVKNYLGMVVKDFKTSETGDTETVKVGTAKTGGEQSVEVSTTYRLYYVDFEGKYGEEGTIYLKADCTNNQCALKKDSTGNTETNVKIKNLNPELYKPGKTQPSSGNFNMQVVTWLLHTDNWESLKKTVSDTYQASVEYIVGAPSLEMMMDSYNTHYDLKGDSPVAGKIKEGDPRKKLFYKYPYDEYNYGYGVGPVGSESTGSNGYQLGTTGNSIQSDPDIDSMYNPGDGNYYWLASPMGGGAVAPTNNVAVVRGDYGGCIGNAEYRDYHPICPVVCLDSSVQLNLEPLPAE